MDAIGWASRVKDPTYPPDWNVAVPKMLDWIHKVGITTIMHCVSPIWWCECQIVHRPHVTTKIEGRGDTLPQALADLIFNIEKRYPDRDYRHQRPEPGK